MCYAKKIFGMKWIGNGYHIEEDLGEDFDGQFHCARFNCKGCDHRLVDGQLSKRNQAFRMNFDFQSISF